MTTNAEPRAAASRSTALNLEEWVMRHGPLWPGAAAALALDLCAEVGTSSSAQLRRCYESLTPAHIIRGSCGEWLWHPIAAAASPRTVHDGQLVERVGAILFYTLSGRAPVHPLGDAATLRAQLRSLRQDVPPEVADVTIDALGARDRGGPTLAALARRLRRAVAVGAEPETHPFWRMGIAVILCIVVTLGAVATSRSTGEVVEPHGLTAEETTLSDIDAEAVQVAATVFLDVGDTALAMLNEIDRRQRARFPSDDPRIGWREMQSGWIWALTNKRATAEVYLANKPSWLATALGERHPYTRAARLLLAATHDARGARSKAAELRTAADRATRALLGDTHASMVFDGVPAPPGTVAHVAPNAPALEGFRQATNGTWYTPLTRVQRQAAGRDGWRVHVVAADACKASFDVGLEPRRVEVDLARVDGNWRARVEMGGRQATLLGSASPTVALSLMTEPGGAMAMRLGEAPVQAGPSAPANGEQGATPPYGLKFAGAGCAVVWLEIPLPAK